MELGVAYAMAVGLVEQHGLTGWTVDFDNAKRRAGVCRHRRRVIGLSAPLTRLHDETEVRDTILHEIAHALVGPEAGHGPVWKAKAREIGCTATRCVPEDAPRVPGDWFGVCSNGHTSERHRRPDRVISCARCAPNFSVEHILEWTYRGRPAPMHPNYQAELDALKSGNGPTRLGPGVQVRIVLAGRYHGWVGTIVRRARTRYHVEVPSGVLTVPFSGVERVQAP